MAIAHASKRTAAAYARILRPAANDIGTPPAFTETSARNVADIWMAISGAEQTLSTFADWKCGIMAWQAAPVTQVMMAAIAAPVMQSEDVILCCGFQPYAWQYASSADTVEIAGTYLGKTVPQNVYHYSVEDIVNYFASNSSSGKSIIVALHIESQDGWNDVREIARAAATSQNAAAFFITTSQSLPQNIDFAEIAPSMTTGWDVSAAAIQAAVTDMHDGYIRVIAAVDDVSAADFDHAIMQSASYAPDAWQEQWSYNSDEAERALWASCKAPVTVQN